jgi:Flp pilus assembly protein TadG
VSWIPRPSRAASRSGQSLVEFALIVAPTHKRGARSERGQSLVELALVLPVLFLLLGGAIQFGVIFATRHELIQVARDSARWAATQHAVDPISGLALPCESAATATTPQPVTEADELASSSGLMAYSTGMWSSANFTSYDRNPMPAAPANPEGVEVAWSGGSCPPTDNSDAQTSFVTVRLSHRAPVFVPGLWLLPGGTCDASGCWISLSATEMFRMEPEPQ